MSIETHPGRETVVRRATIRTWGELTPSGEEADVLRFVFADRIVTVRVEDIRRWEHLLGEREHLILSIGDEVFTIEGVCLMELRIALELRRLTEIRTNSDGPQRPGPRIRAITIEPA